MDSTLPETLDYFIRHYGPTLSPILAVALAALFTYFSFFQQKKYEDTKKEYLDEGIYSIIESLNSAIVISSYNWHQAYSLIQSLKNNGKATIVVEHYHYFKHLELDILKPIEHSKLASIIDNMVFSSLHQNCQARVTAYYHFLITELYTLIHNYINGNTEIEDLELFISMHEQQISETYDEIKSHLLTITLLMKLAKIIESKRISTRTISKFKTNKEVMDIVAQAEEFYNKVKLNPIEKDTEQ